MNNCTDENGGWALGCRIDGGQAEYVRVPFADRGLNKIPDGVSDRQALLVGDVLATGYWAARISEITYEGRYRVDYRGRPYRNLHIDQRDVEGAEEYHRVRARCGENSFYK